MDKKKQNKCVIEKSLAENKNTVQILSESMDHNKLS